MTPEGLRQLIRRVLKTDDDEPDLDAAEAALAPLADALARGDDVSETMAWLEPHLAQCPETKEVLATLVDLARLEAEGALPEVEELWSQALCRARPPAERQKRGPAVEAGGTLRRGVAAARRTVRPLLAWRRTGTAMGWPLGNPIGAPILGLALLAAVGGWWRADHRADESYARLALLEAVLGQAAPPTWVHGAHEAPASVADGCGQLEEALGAVRQERYRLQPNGAWSRVLFDPEGRRALMLCGGLASAGLEELRSWAVAPDGTRHEARVLRRSMGRTGWWLVETDRALSDYEALQLAAGTHGAAVVHVDLGP